MGMKRDVATTTSKKILDIVGREEGMPLKTGMPDWHCQKEQGRWQQHA